MGSKVIRRVARFTTTDGDGNPWVLVGNAVVGGAYIDVYFEDATTPFTCIGVYDYAKGESQLVGERGEVGRKLREWVKDERDQSREDGRRAGEWLDDYIRNA